MSGVSQVQNFITLFQLEDLNGDGQFEYQALRTQQETGLMTENLVEDLDELDNKKGNGFSAEDIRRFLERDGLKKLTQFYPHLLFVPSSSHSIDLRPNRGEVLEGKVSPETKAVKDNLKVLGVSDNFLDNLDVLSLEHIKGKTIVIVLEDSKHEGAIWNQVAFRLVADLIAKGRRVAFPRWPPKIPHLWPLENPPSDRLVAVA